ncbi:MAG: ATP phosphoribosyltransferase [Dehalococcoidales bacterium]|nr:ATP phosphoribosyltransferase [Dehalococcoidales bacterium]
MAVKIALPKGRLLRKTAAMLQKAEWGLDDYTSRTSYYRPISEKFPELLIRVFNEKDIPIQIAMGNYDLGICCLDWIEELLVKYPSSNIVKVRDLAYGRGALYIASVTPLDTLCANGNGTPVRIASEYPNLAESYGLKKRLSRFSVFPVRGAAEAYPPENADMALLSAKKGEELAEKGMWSCAREFEYSAYLIANRESSATKHLDAIIGSICDILPEVETGKSGAEEVIQNVTPGPARIKIIDTKTVRLALPDGHQQEQTVNILNKAGIPIDGYPSDTGVRRPEIGVKGVSVKVIRPQDMPLQVANGNFDIAITGRDWLVELKNQFPSSPVEELLDLKLRKVRIVAVVHNDLNVDDVAGLREWAAATPEPLRVASEYINIADKYARDNHLGHYQVIPTYGASEAFLPDDADLLIENTETGRTIARHNLKIIETIFESTACLIGNTDAAVDPAKARIIAAVTDKLRRAVE